MTVFWIGITDQSSGMKKNPTSCDPVASVFRKMASIFPFSWTIFENQQPSNLCCSKRDWVVKAINQIKQKNQVTWSCVPMVGIDDKRVPFLHQRWRLQECSVDFWPSRCWAVQGRNSDNQELFFGRNTTWLLNIHSSYFFNRSLRHHNKHKNVTFSYKTFPLFLDLLRQ